jgi:hypothetical protein
MSKLMMPTASSQGKVRAPSLRPDPSPKDLDTASVTEEPGEGAATTAKTAQQSSHLPGFSQVERDASVGARMRLVQHRARAIHTARPGYRERERGLSPLIPARVMREAFQDVVSATRGVMIAAKMTPECVAEAMAARKGYGRLKASNWIEGRLPCIRAKTKAVDAFQKVFERAHIANMGYNSEDEWAKLMRDLSVSPVSSPRMSPRTSPRMSARAVVSPPFELAK